MRDCGRCKIYKICKLKIKDRIKKCPFVYLIQEDENKVKGEDMWESPINVMEIQDSFVSEIKEKTEEMVFTEIKRIGIDVDKEELIKALQYDRGQYEKGYSDGYANGIDEFAERMSLEISESIIGGMLFDNRDNSSFDTADKIVDYVIDTAKKIEEEMRGAE